MKNNSKILTLVFVLICVKLFSQNFPSKNFSVNDGLTTNYVYGVVQDSSGTIWAYTEKGFDKFDGYNWINYFPNSDIVQAVVTDNGKICARDFTGKAYIIENNEVLEVKTNNIKVFGLAIKGDDCVCITGNDRMIYKIHSHGLQKNDSIKAYKTQTSNSVTRVVAGNDQFYFYSHIKHQQKIHLFNNSKNIYKEIDLNNYNNKGKREFIISHSRNRFLIFNDKSILIFNNEFEFIETIDLSSMNSYSDTEILNPFFDNENNLWIGTRTKGIIFISEQNLRLSFVAPPNATNIDFKEIGELDNKIIFANNTGDLFYLQNDSLRTFYSSNYMNVHRFFKYTKSGRFFFKNSRERLMEFNFTTKRFNEHSLKYSRLNNLFIDEDDGFFTLSETNGAIFKDTAIIKDLKNPYAQIPSHVIFKNHAGTLLIANSDSLRYLDSLDHLIVTLKKPNEITAINELDHGHYLLGTKDNGFYSYHIVTKKLQNFLSGKSVVKIKIFENQLFIVCSDGIYILNKSFELLEEIHFQSDIVGNDIYMSNDVIYIATSKGVLRTQKGVHAALKDSLLDFNSIKLFSDNIPFENKANLYFDENNISILHPLKHLGSFNKVSYEYRLLPIQKEWTRTKDVTTYFYDLDPNDYIFEIRGIDVYDNIHLPNHEVSFSILKPYYKQGWFLFILFCVVLFSYYLLNVITKSIANQKHKIESSYVKRITELKLQALQAQMNPHFVFNSIGSIQYYIQRKNIHNAEKYLLKFSNLIRYYINNSKEHFSELKEEVNLLECYMDLENMRLEEAFDYKITIDEDVSLNSSIPTMILQPIIDNLINESYSKISACKYSLELKIKNTKDGLLVEIINNGNSISLFNSSVKSKYINGEKNMKFVNLKVDILNEVFDLHTTFNELPVSNGVAGNHILIKFKRTTELGYVNQLR